MRPRWGHRHASERGCGKRRADAGHDLVGHTGSRQSERLFAASTENERVAALEADETIASARALDHELMNGFLLDPPATLPFPDVEALRVSSELQHFVRYQRVVQDDVRLFEALHRLHCQKLGVAGSRTDERD